MTLSRRLGGVDLKKASVDQLQPRDWEYIKICGVASPRQNLRTYVDTDGNTFEQTPTNRVKTYVIAGFEDEATNWYLQPDWYIQSDLFSIFGAPQVNTAIQDQRFMAGQYIPVEPSEAAVANRRRPMRIVPSANTTARRQYTQRMADPPLANPRP